MGASRTRRELLLRTAAVVPSPGDREQLGRLLSLERLAADLYALAAAVPELSPSARRLVLAIREQERAHADALSQAIAGPPRHVRPSPSAERPNRARLQLGLSRAGLHTDLGALRGERAWFTALEKLESVLEGAYYTAIGQIVDPSLATLAARILASEAQHQTLLFHRHNPHDIELDVAVGLVVGNAPPPQ